MPRNLLRSISGGTTSSSRKTFPAATISELALLLLGSPNRQRYIGAMFDALLTGNFDFASVSGLPEFSSVRNSLLIILRYLSRKRSDGQASKAKQRFKDDFEKKQLLALEKKQFLALEKEKHLLALEKDKQAAASRALLLATFEKNRLIALASNKESAVFKKEQLKIAKENLPSLPVVMPKKRLFPLERKGFSSPRKILLRREERVKREERERLLMGEEDFAVPAAALSSAGFEPLVSLRVGDDANAT